MASLMGKVEKLKVCCDPGVRTTCEICADAGLIRELLIDMGALSG